MTSLHQPAAAPPLSKEFDLQTLRETLIRAKALARCLDERLDRRPAPAAGNLLGSSDVASQ